MREFAWMLRRHQDDLMNYFRMPIHNGTVEGLNNKAKVTSHKAYGYSGLQRTTSVTFTTAWRRYLYRKPCILSRDEPELKLLKLIDGRRLWWCDECE